MRSLPIGAVVAALATASTRAHAGHDELHPANPSDDDAVVENAQENPAAKRVEYDRIARPEKTMRFALGGEAGLVGVGAYLHATYPISNAWAIGGRAAYGTTFAPVSGNECGFVGGGGWYSTMDIIMRGRTRLGDWVDFWGSVGAGLALSQSSDDTQDSGAGCGAGPVTHNTFVQSGAVFSAAVGLEAFGTPSFAIEPGLRVQYSTIGDKMPDGAQREGVPVPIALLTLSFAWHVPR